MGYTRRIQHDRNHVSPRYGAWSDDESARWRDTTLRGVTPEIVFCQSKPFSFDDIPRRPHRTNTVLDDKWNFSD